MMNYINFGLISFIMLTASCKKRPEDTKTNSEFASVPVSNFSSVAASFAGMSPRGTNSNVIPSGQIWECRGYGKDKIGNSFLVKFEKKSDRYIRYDFENRKWQSDDTNIGGGLVGNPRELVFLYAVDGSALHENNIRNDGQRTTLGSLTVVRYRQNPQALVWEMSQPKSGVAMFDNRCYPNLTPHSKFADSNGFSCVTAYTECVKGSTP